MYKMYAYNQDQGKGMIGWLRRGSSKRDAIEEEAISTRGRRRSWKKPGRSTLSISED